MYWNRRDQTKQKMRGEWFVSGDKYSVDADGYFWYAGRSDDMFKVGGRVGLADRNRARHHHARGRRRLRGRALGRAVGRAEAEGVRRGEGRDARQRRTWRRDPGVRPRTCRALQVPARDRVPAELPRTATGKLQRFKLR